MNYILVYSLSLLLYQTLYTAEQHRLHHYLAQLAKTSGLDLTSITHDRLHQHGPRRYAIAG